MTVDRTTVTLSFGNTTTTPAAILANVIVLDVNREGQGQFSSGGAAPGNMEYLYNSAGFLEFLIPGIHPIDAFAERVAVVFKY